jgi:acyl carrier protein
LHKSILATPCDIDEEYDIKIPAIEIVPEIFNSIEAILNMIRHLQEE